jgi:hypothetical protein
MLIRDRPGRARTFRGEDGAADQNAAPAVRQAGQAEKHHKD